MKNKIDLTDENILKEIKEIKTKEEFLKFIEKHNLDLEQLSNYTNKNMEEACKLLDKAINSKDNKKALEYAKEAYKTEERCLDAAILISELTDSLKEKNDIIENAINREKEHLTKDGYFEKENIGIFYGLMETRPYIRALTYKARLLIANNKITLAIKQCEEILRLNNSDNMGVRYLLSAIYAYIEDEKQLLKLLKKYPENSFANIFPQFYIYYKLEDDKKTKKYLDLLVEQNPYFIEMIKGQDKIIFENDNITSYQRKEPSEIIAYFEANYFLLNEFEGIIQYVNENID